MDTYEFLDVAWQVNTGPPAIPVELRSVADQSLAKLRNWLKENHVDPYDENTFKVVCLGSFLLLEFLDYAYNQVEAESVDVAGDQLAAHMVRILKNVSQEMKP